MKKLHAGLLSLVLLVAATAFGQGATSLGQKGGRTLASDYKSWRLQAFNTIASGAQTLSLTKVGTYNTSQTNCDVRADNGRTFIPIQANIHLTVGVGLSTVETVTPTSVTNSGGTCSVTATFSSAHSAGEIIVDGTGGLDSAVYDLATSGGGLVTVGQDWTGTTANLQAAPIYSTISIEDTRGQSTQYWNVSPTATTALATPATLTAVTVGFALNGANATGGTYTGASTYHYCISYVDVMGNEGTCSADFSAATAGAGTTNQIGVAAPAASAGAVGYTVYISLAAGSYALSYKVPITSSVCTMTTVETVTAACAVTNATYSQTGSNAIVSALTVNTAMIEPNATTISTTAQYISNPNARTTYGYVPSFRPGIPGMIEASLPFPVGAAANTTVPDVIGTLTIPAGFMNFVGRTIEICGYATQAANGSTATISNIQLWWSAAGSNTTGAGVLIGTIPSTNTLVTANTDQFYFCYDLKTTVAGAGVTAGSILQTGGYYLNQYTTGGVATVPKMQTGQGAAATASLNLAGEARIDVVWLHTTGQDANGLVLQDLTVKILN